MKANFPNQRATKTSNTTVAMTTPTIPKRAVTDPSVLGGLKCDGKAVWKGENKTVIFTVRTTNCVVSRLGKFRTKFVEQFGHSHRNLTLTIGKAHNEGNSEY
jgi:hypothetical protein